MMGDPWIGWSRSGGFIYFIFSHVNCSLVAGFPGCRPGATSTMMIFFGGWREMLIPGNFEYFPKRKFKFSIRRTHVSGSLNMTIFNKWVLCGWDLACSHFFHPSSDHESKWNNMTPNKFVHKPLSLFWSLLGESRAFAVKDPTILDMGELTGRSNGKIEI